MYCLICCVALLGAANEPFDQWVAESHGSEALPESVGKPLSAQELKLLEEGSPTTPYTGLTVGRRLDDGTIWAGSRDGLMCLTPGAKHWRLYHSRRWLPDDRVVDLAVARDGTVWAKAEGGTGRLAKRRWTLDEKMAEIHQMLRRYHLRENLVCEIVLTTPGTVEGGYQQPSADNDGLWTAMYVAAEAFRYGSTGDEAARENAWQSLQALMFLEKITGISGFVARSFLPGNGPDPGKAHGQWHHTPDGKWWWKGDTSSDEVDGHYFAYAVYYSVAATEPQKEQIRAVVGRITDHILDHGYYYVGPSGKPTRWGVWAPEKLNRDLEWIVERGLNSLEILSHLKVAAHITGNRRYAEAARKLIDEHAFAMNTVRQKFIFPENEINHSDDELAFLAYYPLVWYERDPELRRFFSWSIERSFQIERPEESPLFNFIYAAARQANTWTEPDRRPPEAMIASETHDRAACLDWFKIVPADTISWTIDNSRRRDVGPIRVNRFGDADGARLLPVDERLMLRWNADPYELTGGSGGQVQGDGVYILLPYWMGRYHRFIQ